MILFRRRRSDRPWHILATTSVVELVESSVMASLCGRRLVVGDDVEVTGESDHGRLCKQCRRRAFSATTPA